MYNAFAVLLSWLGILWLIQWHNFNFWPLQESARAPALLKHTPENQNIICQQAKKSRTLLAKRDRSKGSVPTN